MAPSVVNATRICFPGWEVRPIERLLLVAGAPVAVGSRAFDVLLALIAGQGAAVRKSALLDAAWPGLVVEENNISVQVAALRKVLGAATISTVPGIGYRLSTPVQDECDGSATAPRSAASPSLPAAAVARAAAGLLGRDEDLAWLLRRVGHVPLVSVVGTGGVGKTALARSLFASVPASGDDLHWIDLAPLRDGRQIAPLLSKALGIELDEFAHARDEMFSALSHARALIAVDNCEHLRIDVADLIDEAIRRAPAVRWLVTSQVPLHVAGEVVYRLGPLPMPRGDCGVAEAATCGALELLRERVTAADRHFVLTDANIRTAVDLCRKLDGLPLAIEMAATRVANLGLERVHQQLGARLRLPSSTRGHAARHHTLRSTFDWSFGLLAHDEQTAFLCLQPFLGGVCDDLAQRMLVGASAAADEWSAGELLGTLVDKSLLHRDGDAPGRFLMLESARDYAREVLEERGEMDQIRRLHAQAVAGWIGTAAEDAGRLGDHEWIERYEPERHNVRVALAWAGEKREPDLLALLVTALALIDTFVQSTSEVVRCDIPMEVLDRAAPGLRANACLETSWAHYMDGSREFGTELALRALDDFRATGDDAGVYRALAQLIRLYESRPDKLAEAREAWRSLQAIDERRVPLRSRLACAISAGFRYENTVTVKDLAELEQLALHAGFDALASVCRVQMTDRLLVEHRFEEALTVAEQALGHAELRPRARGFILTNQALALVRLDRESEARAPARQALRTLPSASYVLVDTFALAAARRGRFVDAAVMAGYGAKVRRDRDELPDPAEAEAIEETLSLLRTALSPGRLAELMQVGAAMDFDGVLAMALNE